MLEYLFSLSLLIVAVIIIRAICKKRVSGKLVYALWLAVILRLVIPVNLISLDLPFPEVSELGTTFLERIENGTTNVSDPSFEIPDTSEAQPVSPVTPDVPKDTAVSLENAPSIDRVNTEEKVIKAEPSAEVIKIDAEAILLYACGIGSLITLLFFAVPFVITGIRLRRNRRYHSTSGNTKVYVSDKVSSPCVMGIVPTIYITPSAEGCKDLELIILHEKTHICHGDHLWAILRIALIIAFWWNPLVWAAALLSKRDAEVACDESVVRTMDDTRRITYGRLILDMIPQKGSFVVAFANKPIKYRIFRLTGKYKTTIIAAVVAVLTITLCFVMAFISNGVDDGKNTILHFHNFSEKATCTTSARCACGDVKGKPLGHKWVDADCENPKTCSRCSLTAGTPLPHTWLEATCDRAKTCKDCKATMGKHLEHIWISATCTADEYCSLCRDTRGSALGHDFSEATCTTAKTCNRCSYTEGDPLGHSYYLGVCTRCSTVDAAFYADIKSKFYSPYGGYSKKSAKKTITGLGYSSDEAEAILSTLNIDWYEQALIAARYYTTNRDFYSEQDFRSNMTYLGFTADEINYSVKIAMEENPPQVIEYDFLTYSFPTDDYMEKSSNYHQKYDDTYYDEDKEKEDALNYLFNISSHFKSIRWDYGMNP